MTLNDADSWAYIKKCLTENGWTEDECDNISDEALEKVVKTINESLVRVHEKSGPTFQRAIARSLEVEKMIDLKITELAAQYGNEIPLILVMALMGEAKRMNEEIREAMLAELGENE
jgi:hypothetical protein